MLSASVCADGVVRVRGVWCAVDGLEETFGDDRLLVGGTDDIHMREAAHYMGAAVDDDHV